MTESNELLPCPFCGNAAVAVRKDYRADMAWIACPNCGLESPTETGVSIDAAISYWNNRLTHPEAQGNKDLGEPAASGLEVTEEMVLRGAIKLASDENHPTLFTQGLDEDGVCAAVRQIYLRRSRTILQAALAAAPTSPQPIKGESELESASNGMGLR